MKELFEGIILSLKNSGFDFELESKLSSYNPLEYFVDQVSEKEILHSQILEELLNENGPHDYKNLFLESFLSLIKCHVPDGCDIHVERERKVGIMWHWRESCIRLFMCRQMRISTFIIEAGILGKYQMA